MHEDLAPPLCGAEVWLKTALRGNQFRRSCGVFSHELFFLCSTMSGVASTLAKKRALAAGFGTNTKAHPYLNQDFESLRAQCRSAGRLFCDPTFPAEPESLGFNELGRNSSKTRGVVWKRPTVRTRAWSWFWTGSGGVGGVAGRGGVGGCFADRLPEGSHT